MRILRIGIPLLCLFQLSCDPLGFRAVSISPIYGWVDGCIDVQVSGHGFDDDVSGKVGGLALENVVLPDPETQKLDVGFTFWARVPANPTQEAGFADLEVTSGGETDSVVDAFYFVACPATGYEEYLSTDTATEGDTITLYGCGIDASAHKVRVGPSKPVDLTSVCGTSQVSFTAPNPGEAGTWYVGIFDASGKTQIYPDPACDISVPYGAVDTGITDTAEGDSCAGVPTLTYGGAR
ncbi:MAG: hypothetical protein JXB39_14810 [Deltaproteobacteria bacterium]|nr:hypothetical protein [Deltaproteobacteria bacterium]